MERSHSELGRLLRGHRAARGLTQEELAERATISARAVSDIERGVRRTIYRDTAHRLAMALGLSDAAREDFLAEARGRPARFAHHAVAGGGRASGFAAPLDRFVGRERELDALLRALRSTANRLITLTGPGGIGKTRLALEAAVRVAADFDTFYFVHLAATREPGLVADTIAHTLGLHAERGSALGALRRYLQERHDLLLLDNFEHLLDAAPLIVELAAASPRLQILVTSRAPLRVTGEREIGVPPLAVPADAPGSDAADETAAVELFVERVRAFDPAFGVDSGNANTVRQIARRLEGIPLAIELAVRRVRHMSLPVLERQLDRRLAVLTLGARDVAPRHQALRATFAWSHDLLDDVSRRLFERLAAFAGGFSLEAAIAVGELAPDETLASIATLVDHSLVWVDRLAVNADRYGMLEVIREFAEDAGTSSGVLPDARRAHAAYFHDLARRAQPHLLDSEQTAWYERLDLEHDNLRVALRWLLTHDAADDALRLAGALWMFWRQHGDFAEGRRWLGEALANRAGSDAARVSALWGAAWLAYQQGDYPAMRMLAEEHLSLARRIADPTALRNALTEQGMVLTAEGRHAEAMEPFDEALRLARGIGGEWIVALSLMNLGHATARAGDAATGERLLTEARERFRSLGDERFGARSAAQLAIVALLRGDRRSAREMAAMSLTVFQGFGERWGIAEGLEILSATELRPEVAARLGGSAEALREETATAPMPFDTAVLAPLAERTRLGADPTVWTAGWSAGRQMTVDEAIALALESTR